MLIGICGGICAGKRSVQDYLIQEHGFAPLVLRRGETPSIERSASGSAVPEGGPSKLNGAPKPQTFASAVDMVDHATQHWQEKFVTTSIYDESIVDALAHRPFFVLVHIDAPISIRWQRFKDCCARASLTPPTLEQFVLRNDDHLYGPSGLATLASRAQIKLLNSTSSIDRLHGSLHSLNLTDQSRIRPAWDHYFMTLASLAARRSNCMRRQVGCVLVREKRVMSTGYNGTPRNVTNCNEGGCPRCNNAASSKGGLGLSTCLCIHAEENALLEAGRERIGGGAVLYCNTCPCLTCSIKIVQVGITEVVFSQSYYMDAEAANLFKEAGVRLRQFSPPKEGLVNLCDQEGLSLPVGTSGETAQGAGS
ncbi:hypothetical protein B0A50_02672 [Salinomyces thailandicus]|uniref:Deoxycytidylate deaminase n=1 Tax=Salinomyces thailandicus TaxID=706561 RepID=A0A4U0U883_9PEZI|nr:hypothetical protein B0A50_02672 [Salinomyces thailandica]